MAHHEFRETCTTTNGGRFAASNSADRLSCYQPNAAYHQETVNAIDIIASATAHDCNSVATLTATVAALTTELAATNTKLIKALVETTKLTSTVGKLHRMTLKPRGGVRQY